MAIIYGDYLIDFGHHDITPEQEREIEAREECARRGLDPDDDAADGVQVWMVVDQELRQRAVAKPRGCDPCGWPECGCQNSPAHIHEDRQATCAVSSQQGNCNDR